MNLLLVSPVSPRSRTGNGVTVRRYAAIFRTLGHRVRIASECPNGTWDVLVALHARKSARAIRTFARRYPGRPIVVVLTGTDLYRDAARGRTVWRVLERADAVVTLQLRALRRIPPSLRRKAVAIVQSASCPRPVPGVRNGDTLRVCVIGHLRREKDPFRTAYALRLLPRRFAIEVVHIGGILDPAYERRAEAITAREPRYRFLGDVPRTRALRVLRTSDVMVLASRMEGGANVLSEAIACGTPVFASRIDGNVGILGARYPGYFDVGDTAALARLLRRAYEDRDFLADVRRRIVARRPLVSPKRERASWRRLLAAAAKGVTKRASGAGARARR
jgi:putative glycosyltransferase (TIGR04348 family)